MSDSYTQNLQLSQQQSIPPLKSDFLLDPASSNKIQLSLPNALMENQKENGFTIEIAESPSEPHSAQNS